MLGSFFLNYILLYILCGFLVAYFGVYIIKRHYLGRIWGAIIISVIGSFLGALMSTVIFSSSMSVYNVAVSILFAAVSLNIYGKASRYHQD